MSRPSSSFALSLFGACLAACSATPATPAATPATPASASLTSTSATAADAGASEPPEPITMQPLFGEGAPRSMFPQPTAAGDVGCLGSVRTTGDHEADYASLIAACGAPTGFAEYAHPVTGDLHGASDRIDTYSLKLAGGYCYRVFAAGDRSIVNLNVQVRAGNGASVAEDTTTAPIAVAGETPFCVAKTSDYRLEADVNGPGFGSYKLGVWARPAP